MAFSLLTDRTVPLTPGFEAVLDGDGLEVNQFPGRRSPQSSI